MAAGEIHVGDVGTVLEYTVTEGTSAVDVSSASVKQVILKKPSGASLTKTAEFSGSGTDGKVRYVTVAGDLSEAGQWYAQVYLELPAGKWHSDAGAFTVHGNL